MHTFQITVQRAAEGGWPVVVERRRPDDLVERRVDGVLQLSADELGDLEGVSLLPHRYGELLGRALFDGPIGIGFAQARESSNNVLRVLLVVEAPDLRHLRWERLFAPFDGGAKWDFLALRQQAPFSLYVPSVADRNFLPIGRGDLRALVVVASPPGLDRDLPAFDVAETILGIRDALAPIPCDALATGPDGEMAAGASGPATIEALNTRLTDGRYTLLHVVCHGTVRGDGETILHLAGPKGQVDEVDATRLLTSLERVGQQPYLAFLSACGSASAAAEAGAHGGLAQRLVRDLGLPAVVAMTDRVKVETATARAEAFYRRLREHGEPDRALVEAAAELRDQQDVTVPVLFSRLRGQPLFSDEVDRPLSDAEIDLGLDRLRPLLEERAPAMLTTFDAHAATIRALIGMGPAGAGAASGHRRAAALDEVQAACQAAVGLSFQALARGEPPGRYDARPPFRGLDAFGVRDRPFFFGREKDVERLRAKLAAAAPLTFLPVLGDSGSGKSSLVLAGLLPVLRPELQGSTRDDNGRKEMLVPPPEYPVMRPGADPIGQFETTLAALPDPTAPLVVDQFEEVFMLTPDEGRRALLAPFFVRLLAEAERRPVILTMRADFIGDCAPYEPLRDAMVRYYDLISPMDARALRTAMERQATAVGLQFEADLANTIFEDVEREPGAMPLLQHALLELWHRRRGKWLLAEEYRALGGVERAIASTADQVYKALSPDDQERVRNIFLRLTRLDDDGARGGDGRDTRRRVALDDLVLEGQDPAAIKNLVAHLANRRLVVVTNEEVPG